MKFQFTKRTASTFFKQLGGLTPYQMQAYLDTIPEGAEMELIFRKKIRWDIGRMRKFFEGPAIDFVKGMYHEQGVGAYGRNDIREFLKAKFLGYDMESIQYIGWKVKDSSCLDTGDIATFLKARAIQIEVGVAIPIKSTTALVYEKFAEFLRDIGVFCMDTFHCGLPESEDVDEGD